MSDEEWLDMQEREHNLRSYQIQPRRRGPKPREFESWQMRVALEWSRKKENK